MRKNHNSIWCVFLSGVSVLLSWSECLAHLNLQTGMELCLVTQSRLWLPTFGSGAWINASLCSREGGSACLLTFPAKSSTLCLSFFFSLCDTHISTTVGLSWCLAVINKVIFWEPICTFSIHNTLHQEVLPFIYKLWRTVCCGFSCDLMPATSGIHII